jgi:hypothetical protein
MSALGILGVVSLGIGILLLVPAILGVAHCQSKEAITKFEFVDDLFFLGSFGFFAGVARGLKEGIGGKKTDLFHVSILATVSIALIVAGGTLIALQRWQEDPKDLAVLSN